MKYLKHYSKIIFKILFTRYRYGKTYLLVSYLRLIIKSIVYSKVTSKNVQVGIIREKMLGLDICFFTYRQLINLFEEIFIYQVYKFDTQKKSPFIIDCGSNIGLSVLYFKKLYPNSRIIAFEPDRESFKLLEENIRINKLSDITPFNFALHVLEAETILYKKSVEPGSLNMSLFKSNDKPVAETVFSKRLSDYINDPVDMVKIDVEGAEVGILHDLIQNKKIKLVSTMIIEYHPTITNVPIDKFITMLREHNFSYQDVKDTLHVGATERMVYCQNNNF